MPSFNYDTFSDGEVKIRYSTLESDSEYMVVAHAFLQKLMKEFARLSIKCYRPRYHASNMPYYYSERRLDSIVLPAISKICDGIVLTEMPVQRTVKKTGEVIGSGHGRADYWCIFRGYSLVIEMKGSWDRYKCKTVRQHSIVDRWGTMIGQLDSSYDECKRSGEKTKGIIRIGLHFVSSIAHEAPTPELIYDDYKDCVDSYMDAFCTRLHDAYNSAIYDPSYAATWLIPDRIINTKYGFDNTTFPGVMLLAKVFKDIKHGEHV